jgi:hypothetical protein
MVRGDDIVDTSTGYVIDRAGGVIKRTFYNYSTQPWTVYFYLYVGAVSAGDPSYYHSTLAVTVNPGQAMPLYYLPLSTEGRREDGHKKGIVYGVAGNVFVDDFIHRGGCYKLSTTNVRMINRSFSPYFKHQGKTGPVVLNGSGIGRGGADGDLAFMEDAWEHKFADSGQTTDPYPYGSTCSQLVVLLDNE